MAVEETKAGYYYSAALHIGIAAALAAFAFVGRIFQKPPEQQPVVFQMVEPAPQAPLQPAPQNEVPQYETIDEPKVKDIKPIDLPEPQPEPEPEPEPAPKPDAKTPDKSPAPKPKEAEKTAPPKRISIDDFRKKNPAKPRKQAPRARSKPVKIDKISPSTRNLDRFANQSRISVKGGTSSAMKNALGAYAQYINALAKRNWVMPGSITGMELSCTVMFNVSAAGATSSVRIIKSSGNSDFDESALKLFKGLRLVPPPDGEPHNISLVFTTEK